MSHHCEVLGMLFPTSLISYFFYFVWPIFSVFKVRNLKIREKWSNLHVVKERKILHGNCWNIKYSVKLEARQWIYIILPWIIENFFCTHELVNLNFLPCLKLNNLKCVDFQLVHVTPLRSPRNALSNEPNFIFFELRFINFFYVWSLANRRQ